MEGIEVLLDYFKKLQRAINNADLKVFKYKFVKKSRIDDLLVCTLAVMPESYKKAMKKRVSLDLYPSVACYNRLYKMIKRTFFLASDYYMIDFHEATVMLGSILRHLESDIKKLEEE
jgi:hypothetical protein